MQLGTKSYWPWLTLASALLACSFAVYYQYNPSIIPGADAWGYVFHAFRFRTNTPLFDFGGVRTFGYPFFLYLLTFVSGLNPSRLALTVSVVQYGMFLASTGWLVHELMMRDKRLATAVFIGLALNPVILSSVTDVLTEGLSIIGMITMTASILSATRLGEKGARYLVLGTFVLAAVLMVRPGNIVFVIAWLGAVTAFSFGVFRREGRQALARALLLLLGGTLASTILVLGPQALYNFKNFNTLSLMPACDLGDFQIYTSVLMWRYETIVLPDGQAAGLNYLNPFADSEINGDSPLLWYISHPFAGILTLAMHIFNLFSVTSLFTYIRDPSPAYAPILRIFYWIIVLGGLLNLLKAAFQFASRPAKILSPPCIFIGLSFLGAVALGSITAVEQRFGIIPLCIASAAFCYGLSSLPRNGMALRLFGATTAVALICVGLSYQMDQLASRDFRDLEFSFAFSENCRVTLDGKSWPELFKIYDEMTSNKA